MKKILYAGLFLASVATAAVPGSFIYQGSLKQNGALVNGTVAIQILLTDADGNQVYWPGPVQSVPVKEGLYRVELAPTGVDWANVDPYIETRVNGAKLLPREKLSSSPYALLAKDLAPGATAKGDFIVSGKSGVGISGELPARLTVYENKVNNVNTLFGAGYGTYPPINGNRQFWIQQWMNSVTAKTYLVGNGYVTGTTNPVLNDGPYTKFQSIMFSDGEFGFIRNNNGSATPAVIVKDNSGYVGVNTSNPTESLEVAGSIKASSAGRIYVDNNTNNGGFGKNVGCSAGATVTFTIDNAECGKLYIRGGQGGNTGFRFSEYLIGSSATNGQAVQTGTAAGGSAPAFTVTTTPISGNKHNVSFTGTNIESMCGYWMKIAN